MDNTIFFLIIGFFLGVATVEIFQTVKMAISEKRNKKESKQKQIELSLLRLDGEVRSIKAEMGKQNQDQLLLENENKIAESNTNY